MLDTSHAVFAGRSEWAKAPRHEVGAFVMTARLTLGLSEGACSYADSLVSALFENGAAWVKIEAYAPATDATSPKVLP